MRIEIALCIKIDARDGYTDEQMADTIFAEIYNSITKYDTHAHPLAIKYEVMNG